VTGLSKKPAILTPACKRLFVKILNLLRTFTETNLFAVEIETNFTIIDTNIGEFELAMLNDPEEGLNLSRLALSLAVPACKEEDVAVALREQLASTVPGINDEICASALNWLAQAATRHVSSKSDLSAAEMQQAALVATAFCEFRRGQTA
jgi:hypothetical protein